jgi:hypothetical protein
VTRWYSTRRCDRRTAAPGGVNEGEQAREIARPAPALYLPDALDSPLKPWARRKPGAATSDGSMPGQASGGLSGNHGTVHDTVPPVSRTPHIAPASPI